MKYKTIIVDDERLARREMRRLLAEFDEIAVAGEAENLAEAALLIEKERPHIVFLDIQLSGESGFDLLEKTAHDFKLIFVTAFDAYAIRAFEVNALDYLLKPVNPERLAKAIERVGEETRAGEKADFRAFEFDDRIFLELGNRSVFLKVCDISHINSAGDYSEVLTRDKRKFLLEKSLREWEERLPEKHFLRIHRQTIINLEEIEEIETWFNRTFQVRLKNCRSPLAVSRRYAVKLKNRFS
ncbi:MAG TPA: LytTR family transcriptional regulator DNA-binding domain-containing protein [Pyrinomonadaceae bacterium]|jgi:two-component system LytT family response regulator